MADSAIDANVGEVIELLYRDTYAKVIAEIIGIPEHKVRWYIRGRKIKKGRLTHPLGFVTTYHNRLVVKVKNDHPQQHRKFAFAHVLAWEKAHGRKVPEEHVVVLVDGDSSNLEPGNLYCMPRSDLLNWARFVMQPVEVLVDKLWRKVMALDTSEKVKQKLLEVLESVVDPDKTPDLMRQRAVCETVNTLIGLLRVEVTYLQAIEGDGVIPFLEAAREDLSKRRDAARTKRRGLISGPAADHPWRGLGEQRR